MIAVGSITAYPAPKDGISIKGDTGLTGQTVMQVKWVPGATYYNEQTGAFRRIDILITFTSTGAVAGRYQCNATYTSAVDELPPSGTGNSHWTRINTLDTLYTPLLVADTGEITFLSSNQLLIKKADGTITAGMSGAGTGATGYRFWAGAQSPSDAPFKVNELGEVDSEKGRFKGGLISEYINLNANNVFNYVDYNIDTGAMSVNVGANNLFCFLFEVLPGAGGTINMNLNRNIGNNGFEAKIYIANWSAATRTVKVNNLLSVNYSTNTLSRVSIQLQPFKEYRFRCLVFEPYSGYPLSLVDGKAVEWMLLP